MSTFRTWILSTFWSVVVWTACVGYVTLYEDGYSVAVLNRSLALAASILVTYSFALAGLSFYMKAFRGQMAFRRMYGVLGFVAALCHGAVSAVLYVIVYSYPAYIFMYRWDVFGMEISNTIAFAFGVTALVSFAFMASISNNRTLKRLGAYRWRAFLRAGYVALAYVLIHFSIKAAHTWVTWITTMPLSLPPPSLFIAIAITVTFVLRLMLWYDIRTIHPSNRPS